MLRVFEGKVYKKGSIQACLLMSKTTCGQNWLNTCLKGDVSVIKTFQNKELKCFSWVILILDARFLSVQQLECSYHSNPYLISLSSSCIRSFFFPAHPSFLLAKKNVLTVDTPVDSFEHLARAQGNERNTSAQPPQGDTAGSADPRHSARGRNQNYFRQKCQKWAWNTHFFGSSGKKKKRKLPKMSTMNRL